jgi:hypothetical protein
MLDALAQATYTYTTTSSTDETGAAAAVLGLFTGVFLLIMIPLIVFYIVCLWKTFEKAGVEGWKAIVPGYNGWVLAEIAGKPGWWGIVGFASIIPVVGWFVSIAAFVLYVLIAIELSKKFGKDSVFAVLLILLPVVGFAILAFGDAKYNAKAGGPDKPAAPAKA